MVPDRLALVCKECGVAGSVNIVPNWHDKVRSCCAIHQALETMSPWLVKLTADRPYADPEKAARRILEIANALEPVQGRIHIEKINEPFLFRDRGSPAEYVRGPQTRDRARLAQDARIRDLRHIHARRRRAVRLAGKERAFRMSTAGNRISSALGRCPSSATAGPVVEPIHPKAIPMSLSPPVRSHLTVCECGRQAARLKQEEATELT